MKRLPYPWLALLLCLTACAGTQKAAGPPDVVVVENVDATGDVFVYYSLRDNLEVTAEDHWDVAFRSTVIRANGGVQALDQPFDAVAEAPEEGYEVDTEETPALSTASGEGWYDYDAVNHVVTPIPDRTLVFRLRSGAYAKMEILDFYLPGLDEPRFYTFRYAYQPGSRRLK